MITWSLLITVEVLIHLSNAFIIVEHDDGSHSACNQTYPCTNLQTALHAMKSGSKLIISAGDNYTLSNEETMTMDSIVIVGEGSDNTMITCDSNAGLAFTNMQNITIANLTLKECGAWRNSTTKNDTNNFTYKFRCSLYFLNCSEVTIYDVIVTDSQGTGVMMYDVLGTVTIEQSQFKCNRVPIADKDTTPGGGGVYIEFTYCLPNTTNFTACTPTSQSDATYIINNCTFTNNTGTAVKETTTKYIFPIGAMHQQFGRGGGLSMHFKGNATNNNITITNCIIGDNMAVWGGGVLIDLLDSAQSNRIVIKDVTFINNSIPIKTGTGGGALRINYFPQVQNAANIVNVTGCNFDSNSAYFGGAVSLSPKQEERAHDATNRITFNRCVWQNNRAHIGSAIDLSSYFNEPGGLSTFAVFKNCSFIGNYHMQISDTELHIGMGTFHSDGISFSFEGDNYFIRNNEAALMIAHATVDFEENATAEFVDNHGYRGGAMALLGNTWLNMHRNTTVLFINNSADDKGGAMYYVSAGVRDVNSRKCFIRYYDYQMFPCEWNTSFIFINNTSRNPGHAIYCTTLVTCSWSNTSIETSPEVLRKTFRWENAFAYDDYQNDTIATDPATVNINITGLQIIPGKLHLLNLSVCDDLGIPRKTVFFVHSNNESAGNLASTSTYIADDQIKVLGTPGEFFLLHFYTVSTKVLSFTINTTLATCPPGYYFPTDTANSSHSKCICSINDEHQRYDHIPHCRESAFKAVLQPQFWAGYPQNIQDGSILVTAKCPSGYCYANGSKKLLLSTEAELNELICSPNNRRGTLCGRCENGYYIYANAKDYKCGKCSVKNGYVWQFFAKYFPLIIFLLTIILLDINLASGLLNTFVFFSQMLPSLDLYAGGEIPINDAAKPFVEIYQFCYGIFNLQYFESLDSVPGWCTVEYSSALTGVMFGYIEAFCPLVIIFIVWLIIFFSDYCTCGNQINVVRNINNKLRQLYRRIKHRDVSLSESFFRGLVTFILLSYTKFTLVTLTLLAPAYLYGPGGHRYSVVANLDGTLEYFGHEHLRYVIPAIFVLVFIVLLPPVLFATYPCMCNCLGIPTHKLMHFFDTLYGAFRKEHKLCGHFALLYFVYRIVIVAIFTFMPEIQQRYTLQQLVISVVLMLHVIAQPYRERFHNIVDVCLLALIPAVVSISFFQLFRATNSNSVDQFAMAIQIILLYIPLIYLAVVIVYQLYLWKRRNGYEQIDHNNNNDDILASGNDQLKLVASNQYQGGDEANHDNKL